MGKYYCGVKERLEVGEECLWELNKIDPNNDKTCRECEHYQFILFQNQKISPKEHLNRNKSTKAKATLKTKKNTKTKLIPEQSTAKVYLDNKEILECFHRFSTEYNLEEVFPPNDDWGKRIQEILPRIPNILNLHHSFWENPYFLRRQLMRLNKNYRCESGKHGKDISDWTERENPIERIKTFIFKGSFEEWKPKHGDNWCQYFNAYLRLYITSMEFISNHGEPFNDWSGRLNDIQNEAMHWWAMIDLYLPLSDQNSLRIPFLVRFPLPCFLKMIPAWPTEKKRRPANWPRDLLVYELSQAGMMDTDIAILLFGRKVHHPYHGKNDKDEILSTIAGYKKTAKKSIEQAYPFT